MHHQDLHGYNEKADDLFEQVNTCQNTHEVFYTALRFNEIRPHVSSETYDSFIKSAASRIFNIEVGKAGGLQNNNLPLQFKSFRKSIDSLLDANDHSPIITAIKTELRSICNDTLAKPHPNRGQDEWFTFHKRKVGLLQSCIIS